MDKNIFDAIRRAAESDNKRVKINFAGVAFMDSATIESLVRANKLAMSLDVELCLVNVSPNVLEVCKITQLNKLFRIDD